MTAYDKGINTAWYKNMGQQEKKSKFNEFKKANFPGLEFLSKDRNHARRLLKEYGEKRALEYLADKGKKEMPNLQPPAKVNIICTSRPFQEWPIYKVSIAIQEYVYGLTKSQIDQYAPGTSKDSHKEWFKTTGIDNFGFPDVAGLNKIFPAAYNRYKGVLKKVENRNNKLKKKFSRNSKGPDQNSKPVEAFDINGKLLQPPGVNGSIYCWGNVNITPFKISKFPNVNLPKEYEGYFVDPDEPIKHSNRKTDILKGEPGFVPEWQRVERSNKKSKRRRKWYSNTQIKQKPRRTYIPDQEKINQAKANDSLLAILKIGSDWAVFDLRGLLRNVYYRNLVNNGINMKDLLAYFTGDPVIDPGRNTITFRYREGVINTISKNTIKRGKTKEIIEKLLIDNKEIGAVSIDLGQTNPASMLYSIIRDDLSYEKIKSEFLPKYLLDKWKGIKQGHDALNSSIDLEAYNQLSKEQQRERDLYKDAAKNKEYIIKQLNISDNLPWDEMTSRSTFISDYLINHNIENPNIWFETKKSEDKKYKAIKRKDRPWMSLMRLKTSNENNDLYKKIHQNLQISNRSNFEKLAKRKLEWARECANYATKQLKQLCNTNEIIVIIEDLSMRNHTFGGSGKREIGWDNFFFAKKENRWPIEALHKAFSELAINKGLPVCEINPAGTSITCVGCGYRDEGNRDGEKFVCLKCNLECNADLGVATENVLKVGITGLPMPKPPCDHAAKKLIGARQDNCAEGEGKTAA